MPSNKRVAFFSKCPLGPPAKKKRLPPPHGGKRKWAQRECNSAREPHCNLRSGSFSWIPQGYWLDVVVGRSACWITTLANLCKQLFLDRRFLLFEPFHERSANFLKCLFSQFAFQPSKTFACRSVVRFPKNRIAKKKHHPSTNRQEWLLQSSQNQLKYLSSDAFPPKKNKCCESTKSSPFRTLGSFHFISKQNSFAKNLGHTLSETNEKPSQKEKASSSNHQFSRAKCEFQGGVVHPTWRIIPFRKYLSTNHGDRCCPRIGLFLPFSWLKKMEGGILTTYG